MGRGGQIAAGVAGAVVLVLALAQLILPRVAASRISSRIGRYGKVQSVSVSAWPAVELLWAVAWAAAGAAGVVHGYRGWATAAIITTYALFGLGEAMLSPTLAPLVADLAPARLVGQYNSAFALVKQLALAVGPAALQLNFADAFAGTGLEAYERLILDVMRGDHTLFTRSDEIERLWEVSAPLIDAMPEPLPYARGSWGPDAARTLPAPRRWRLPYRPVEPDVASAAPADDARTETTR